MDMISLLENGAAVAEGTGAAMLTRKMLGERALSGAFYAVGAEKIVGNLGFGAVFSDQNFSNLSRQAKFGVTNIMPSNGTGLFSNPLKFEANLPGNYSTAVGSNLIPGGIIQGSKLSVALPLALSAVFGIQAVAEEGVQGLPGYLVRDAFANYSAMNATVVGGDIIDRAKADKFLKVNTGTAMSYQYAAGLTGPYARMPLLARASSIMVAHTAASIGATAGSAFLSGAASVVNNYVGMEILNENITGMFGYIFGAAGGAAVGANIGSSLAGLAIAGAGIYAMKEVVSSTYAMVEGGFARAQRNKGLNYAGDTAAFFTQNAVTMRERALQAMNKSHMNARSAFGQEANIVHMNRDMFSHYKRY
jgi:hypothetical protein